MADGVLECGSVFLGAVPITTCYVNIALVLLNLLSAQFSMSGGVYYCFNNEPEIR